jgi:hypothetical protein
MDLEIVKPFVKAVKDVIEKVTSVQVIAPKPFLKDSSDAQGDVTSLIGTTGGVEGVVAITIPEMCILPIISSMLKRAVKGLGKKDLSQSCLSFDPAAALLRAVNILDIPHSKRLASGPNYGAIFGQIFFSEALTYLMMVFGKRLLRLQT